MTLPFDQASSLEVGGLALEREDVLGGEGGMLCAGGSEVRIFVTPLLHSAHDEPFGLRRAAEPRARPVPPLFLCGYGAVRHLVGGCAHVTPTISTAAISTASASPTASALLHRLSGW